MSFCFVYKAYRVQAAGEPCSFMQEPNNQAYSAPVASAFSRFMGEQWWQKPYVQRICMAVGTNCLSIPL